MQILSISVNTVFRHCCQVSEASDQDKRGREPFNHVELLTKYEAKLPSILTVCGRHFVLHHLDITKKLFYYILPNLGLKLGHLKSCQIMIQILDLRKSNSENESGLISILSQILKSSFFGGLGQKLLMMRYK